MKLQRVALILTALNLVVLVALLAERRTSADPAISPVVRTNAFELVDNTGKVRAQMSVEQNGDAVFRLRGADGTIRAKFATTADGSGLVLMDERTEATVQIRANKDGGGIVLFSRDGRRNVLK